MFCSPPEDENANRQDTATQQGPRQDGNKNSTEDRTGQRIYTLRQKKK
jgi:hypothetical protein